MAYDTYNPALAYPGGLDGIVDTLTKVAQGVGKVVDVVRVGGRIVVNQPGGVPYEIDTRDPALLQKVKEAIAAIKSNVQFKPGERPVGYGERVGGAVGGFLSTPGGLAVVGGAALVLFMLSQRRRGRR